MAHLDKAVLRKARTGIKGLDDITGGGLPQGRPTLVVGSAGCGKTLLSLEFLVCGAREYKEPGIFVTFEETEKELEVNVASLGIDLKKLVDERWLILDHVRVERSEIEETGEYDLEGLFVRLGHAIDSINARRVVLDSLETLFSGLKNTGVLRAELRRLFSWLKEKGVTAIITGEKGTEGLTRHGLEEYVSDCVISLDHRTTDQLATRRLRVVKYRGSVHGTNEYPFIIDDHGISIFPITSLELNHTASAERVSSGIPKLDQMLGGKGYFLGSTILASGTAGSGKTSLAASFAKATCERGEKCLYFCFEESQSQLFRNMHSIGLDLAPFQQKGLLRVVANRPSFFGIEMHLVAIHKQVEDFQPASVIMDPVTNLGTGDEGAVRLMLTRLIDSLKGKNITAFFTSLTPGGRPTLEDSSVGISSLIDTWILLKEIEAVGERNRGLYILKSRGMKHSNQIREFLISPAGIDLVDVYAGANGILTGSARKMYQAQEELRNRIALESQGRINLE